MADNSPSEVEVVDSSGGGLVVRSEVPPGLKYGDYRRYLRADFSYSCAYCSMSEAEAQAIRFTIDHYEPQASRPELKDDYMNLMYCCDECNVRKGDRSPPEIARAAGFRFFRPDNDNFGEHFERSGVRLNPKSATGDYSINALDLNRLSLRRLREIRARLVDCDAFVDSGVRALKSFQIDKLPKHIRGKALGSIRKADFVADRLASEIEAILSSYASSPLLDKDDPLSPHAEERRAKLAQIESLHPGQWRRARPSSKATRS
ncbi:HNH endonuclease [Brevundimonas sp.]|uniref:HNH endonuclease n=1 Tax=Brevundimonas sp. TaxID=1871086 RepID=UPI002D614CC9|nr:HNH endonuclease [Brevundimonas sp.]HYC69364.1 HNH endonuclease [Brevundimonas sp.]